MAKLKYLLLALTISVAMVVILFIGSLQLVIFNEVLFRWHYETHQITETTKMTLPDLMTVTDQLLDYIKDKEDHMVIESKIDGINQEIFGEREKAHMIDVKNLYIWARNMQWLSLFLVVIIIGYGWMKSKIMLYETLSRVKYVIPLLLTMMVGIGILFATDFNKYFTIFHELFFSNDLWLLDPKTDIMINMVPEIYFYTVVMMSLALFVLSMIITVVGITIIGKRFKAYAMSIEQNKE
ncbi:TIGR01906 family membrane protein [Petrocella sp. FN5]|uniref:TIGR01906 family membrane protein n=1 Tax=Petrocella sp. FN5 TaxID=3032002 RepID=UPI0023DB4D8C|nr:TIGR01906 family membrane protein [Petrocella sp. FN5]MDF1617831.1 TIGR01906 family membrane protein [Petrocella sp. FN5]